MQLLRDSVLPGVWFQPLYFRCHNLIKPIFLKNRPTKGTLNDNTYLYYLFVFYSMNFLRTATTKTDFLWSHGGTTSTWPEALSCSNGLSHLQVRNVPKILKGKKKTLERQHLNPWTSLCPYDYITRLNNTVPSTKQRTLLHCSSQHERNIHYIQFATNNTKSVHVQIFFKITCADKTSLQKKNINFMKKN